MNARGQTLYRVTRREVDITTIRTTTSVSWVALADLQETTTPTSLTLNADQIVACDPMSIANVMTECWSGKDVSHF